MRQILPGDAGPGDEGPAGQAGAVRLVWAVALRRGCLRGSNGVTNAHNESPEWTTHPVEVGPSNRGQTVLAASAGRVGPNDRASSHRDRDRHDEERMRSDGAV